MPTYHKAQLDEMSMPFVEVWDLMRKGLEPVVRRVLTKLKFYKERDLEPVPAEVPLSDEEEAELRPVVSALTVAAVLSEEMKLGPLVSTLARVRKRPGLFRQGALPAAVLWELAQDYQRDWEPPGTFSMDIWGSEQTAVPYIRVAPNDEAVAAAAARGLERNQKTRSPGRPDHPAHQELAKRLAVVFGKSELGFARCLLVVDCKDGVRYAEGGAFFDFLKLVLPPLRDFLSERRLPPVTTESIVRAAQAYVAERLAAHPPSTPDYSHGSKTELSD
ncbi:hypothetical protein [Bradyrhizobium sp. SSUT77]|uniref:hypothetical protein n=1 Tax=Bradyrhizobium sp. SSUT77 TaxID=3040603 RepID=UPI00244C7147|nr:hypothetical protein [Bradyrhizobium sp. SSUT77]MDH2343450.1 hypothetical protein [Bradyrhizobium sp. SSUT77]